MFSASNSQIHSEIYYYVPGYVCVLFVGKERFDYNSGLNIKWSASHYLYYITQFVGVVGSSPH